MKDIMIIGSGLFGKIIASHLFNKGLETGIIDSEEIFSGSKPAACLMKPSWYSSMGKDVYTPAMETLESLYDIRTIEFQTKIKKVPVKWIDPRTINAPMSQRIMAKITRLFFNDDGRWRAEDTEGNSYWSDKCIIASGVWCNEILKNSCLRLAPTISPLTGTAFLSEGKIFPEISIWNPYKQLVKFNITPEQTWVGDGIASKNYFEKGYLSQSQERCARFLGKTINLLTPMTGHRPYVKDAKPCYLEEHAPGLWVVTGGAKNGTIAAGWAAHRLGEILG